MVKVEAGVVAWRTDATQSRPYPIQLGQHAVLPLPSSGLSGRGFLLLG